MIPTTANGSTAAQNGISSPERYAALHPFLKPSTLISQSILDQVTENRRYQSLTRLGPMSDIAIYQQLCF